MLNHAYICPMQWVDVKTRITGMLRYLWAGKSRYHIHSPFVFKLVNGVLRDKRPFYDLQAIKTQRNRLLNDRTTINIQEVSTTNAPIATTVATLTRRTAIPKKYGELLFRLVNYYQAQRILEVGTGLGISTAYISCANRSAQVIGLEGDEARADVARKVLSALRCPVDVRVGKFEDTLQQAVLNLGEIDMVFLDGNHKLEPTLQYFEVILPALHENSLVIVDDIYWSAEMLSAWEILKSHPRVTLSVDLYRMGLLFFTLDFKQPQHHQLYY